MELGGSALFDAANKSLHMKEDESHTLAGAYARIGRTASRQAIGYGTDNYIFEGIANANNKTLIDTSKDVEFCSRVLFRVNTAGSASAKKPVLQWVPSQQGIAGGVYNATGGNADGTINNLCAAVVNTSGNYIGLSLGSRTGIFDVVVNSAYKAATGRVTALIYVNGVLGGTYIVNATGNYDYTQRIPLAYQEGTQAYRGFYLNKTDYWNTASDTPPWSPDIEYFNVALWMGNLTGAEVAFMHKVDKARFVLEV
jgi:hypothetical protein